MPFNAHLRRSVSKAQGPRVIDNLLALRKRPAQYVPRKDADENLLIATWSIRDLGAEPARVRAAAAGGARVPRGDHARFEFVAVQEVNRLEEWERIMDLLGPSWSYIATDVTDTALGGIGERMTFVFAKRKVRGSPSTARTATSRGSGRSRPPRGPIGYPRRDAWRARSRIQTPARRSTARPTSTRRR